MNFKKIILLFAIFCTVFFNTGCHRKGDSTDDGETIDLTDEEGATTFRIYFETNGGNKIPMQTVNIGEKVIEPDTPVKEGYAFRGWFLDKDFNTLYRFTTMKVSCSLRLYAKWEEAKQVDYTPLLDQYVPTEASDNFVLPYKDDNYPGAYFVWQSADEYTISSKGIVNPDYNDKMVSISLKVTDDYGTYTVGTRECMVRGIRFTKALKNNAVFGYYSTWYFNGISIQMKKIDVVNASFAYVASDLSLDMSRIDGKKDDFLAFRKNGIRVCLSIQGAEANSGNFSKAAQTVDNRKTFANNILNIVKQYHFDGVDIDWEYPGWKTTSSDKHAEAANYTALMKEIYTVIKEFDSNLLVTAAVPGGSEGYQRYDLEDVSNYLDYFHLMTYDLESSTRVFHHTALYSNTMKTTATQASVEDSVFLYNKYGNVAKEKLVIGIAFYGKWTIPSTSTNGGLGSNAMSAKYTTIAYSDIYNRYLANLNSNNVSVLWDNIAHANYLYIKDENTFITYDSEKSIAEKCDYALSRGLGGVMIWELGEDTTDSLLKAVNRNMGK